MALLGFPEGATYSPYDPPNRSLTKIVYLLSSLLTMLGLTNSVLSGTGSPEGVQTGAFANQIYVQLDGAGIIVGWWMFNGTIGTTTGWTTNL